MGPGPRLARPRRAGGQALRGAWKAPPPPAAGVNQVLLSGRLRGRFAVRANPRGALELRFWLDLDDAAEPGVAGPPQLVLVRDPAVAEALRDHLRHGSYLYVEGALRTLRSVGRDGRDQWRTVVCARRVEVLCAAPTPTTERSAPWAREPLPAAAPP